MWPACLKINIQWKKSLNLSFNCNNIDSTNFWHFLFSESVLKYLDTFIKLLKETFGTDRK